MILILSESKFEKHGNFKGRIGSIDFLLINRKFNL